MPDELVYGPYERKNRTANDNPRVPKSKREARVLLHRYEQLSDDMEGDAALGQRVRRGKRKLQKRLWGRDPWWSTVRSAHGMPAHKREEYEMRKAVAAILELVEPE